MLGDITTSLRFVKPGSWPANDKLYTLLYVPTDGTPLTNFLEYDVSGITIRDMRPLLETLCLDKQGFTVAKLKSKMVYHDFEDDVKIKTVFAAEIRQMLSKILPDAEAMYIHECVIRKRSMLPAHKNKGFGQPVTITHTADYVKTLGADLTESQPGILDGRRIQMINCWKPLRGPLKDWPLAVCDLQSVQPEDYLPIDEVHGVDTLESQHLLYNPKQRWYYLREQGIDEVLVFKSADNLIPGEVPHGAFEDPTCPKDEPMRESVELRIMVVYGKEA